MILISEADPEKSSYRKKADQYLQLYPQKIGVNKSSFSCHLLLIRETAGTTLTEKKKKKILPLDSAVAPTVSQVGWKHMGSVYFLIRHRFHSTASQSVVEESCISLVGLVTLTHTFHRP